MLSVIYGSLASLVLLFSAAVHLYWGFGGRWWIENIIPQRNGIAILPTSGPVAVCGFILIAMLLTVAAACVMIHSGLADEPFPSALPFASLSVKILIAVFILRAVGDFNFCGIFRAPDNTRFAHWDRGIYTPICGVLALLLLLTF